jgi:hypothetical protein
LSFDKLSGRHTGEALAQHVFLILETFEIAAKLFCITTDDAGNNRTMIRELSNKLLTDKGIEWDPEKMHINCLDHVINLAVQKFLSSIKIMPDDDNDGEDGSSLQSTNSELGTLFSTTMSKIRAITKVYS